MSGLAGLTASATGLKLRTIEWVPAKRADAHSAPAASNLIPLNDPVVSG